MPRGKPWNVDEEKRLGEFLRSGVSVQGIAKAMGKTLESVQVKVLRLGLEVEGGVFCVATTSTTTSLPDVGLDAGKGVAVVFAWFGFAQGVALCRRGGGCLRSL